MSGEIKDIEGTLAGLAIGSRKSGNLRTDIRGQIGLAYTRPAKQLGRNYLGIEINPKSVKIAEDRLRQEVLF